MIDLKEVGVKYVATDKKGKKITFQIIYYDSLIEMVGLNDCNVYDLDDYRKNVYDAVKGFVDSPYDITWYSVPSYESNLVDAVKEAITTGNHTIVIEYTDID